MSAKYIFAFGKSGFCGASRKRGQLVNLPESLKTSYESPKLKSVLWVAIGPADKWFLSWIDKDGSAWLNGRDLDPDLDAWLRKDLTKDEILGTRVYLGLDGRFFAHSPQKGSYRCLSGDVLYEYKRRIPAGVFNQDPNIIAFGKHDAWVLVGEKGDFMWDLKGHYQELEKVLNDSEFGIEHIALSLWNTTDFFVVFTDESFKSHTDQKITFMD